MDELNFVIPIAPVTKKNSQRILRTRDGRSFIAPSSLYAKYEKEVCKALKGIVVSPITAPVTVKATFYMKTHRRVDKSNLEEALHDVLVKAGILADDNRNIIASSDGTRVYCDPKNPRTEVTITPLMEEYEVW